MGLLDSFMPGETAGVPNNVNMGFGNGLLDFLKTPNGQALASGLATYAATARRGTPINNIGRGLLGGLSSLSDQQAQAEAAKMKSMQMQQMQMQMDKAKKDQERQSQWEASVQGAFKPTYAQAPFNQQQEAQLAEQISAFPDFQGAARLTNEAGDYAQKQTGMEFDPMKLKAALPFAPAGIQDEILKSTLGIGKDEGFTLTPGSVRYQGGKQIASAPVAPKNEIPSDLKTVGALLGLPENPAMWNEQQRTQATDQLIKLKQSGAASLNNYGSPVQGIGPNGKPVFFQPSPRGEPPRMISGITPMGKEGESKAPSGFRFTADGNLEAIPGGPADLKNIALTQKQIEGAGDVQATIANLRSAYDRLEQGGGITSTKKGALSNIGAYASSSDIGQGFGKMFGTENQSARNDITMSRPALLAALMKATGMSAKQMDSNAELKLWITTATDTSLDVEANRRALDRIESKYLSAPKVQSPPKFGEKRNGYYYKGGDPASPSSWVKVKP